MVNPHVGCRSVRGLTLRLADVELTPAGEGRQAVGVALPLMLETGEAGWEADWQPARSENHSLLVPGRHARPGPSHCLLHQPLCAHVGCRLCPLASLPPGTCRAALHRA